MTLTEQVYAQACLLAGQLEAREQEMLRVLCAGAVSTLSNRLRSGLTPGDLRADFVAAASLYALASMSQLNTDQDMDEIKVGDVTLKRRDADTASKCLHHQAELIMAPYLADRFSFRGI